jgi:putative membrane protein
MTGAGAVHVPTESRLHIDAGKLAETQVPTQDIKAFGKQTATDHAGVNQHAVVLLTNLKAVPQDDPMSRSPKAGGAESVKKLQSLQGAAFDKAYIDKTLLPNAKNEELRALTINLLCEETGVCIGIPPATVRPRGDLSRTGARRHRCTRYFRVKGLLREALARELDFALEEAFPLDGERCDRIVASVLQRLKNLPAAST